MNSTSSFLGKISKKDSILANLFWGAFTIYSIMVAYAGTANPNYNKAQAIQLISLAIMLPTLFMLIRFEIKNGYLKMLYICYLFWLLYILVSGYSEWSNYGKFKKFLFNPVIGLVYLAPLVMLFPLKISMIKKLFIVIAVFGIAYLILDLIFFKNLLIPNRTDRISQGVVESFADVCFSCGFLLFTFGYHTKKINLIAFIALFASLLFATIQARRGLIFMFSLMFLISYIIFILSSKRKLIIIYFSILLLIISAFYITSSYKLRSSNLFGFLMDRGNEDTRSGVETYFYDDMKTQDWIIGRGVYGSYFAPKIEENQETNNRDLIETGYLHIILKGGLISLCLFLLIALPAVIKGLFYSKNNLSKAAAIWVCMALLNSYPTIQNVFNLNYLLVWICISICYSKEIRRLNEKELIQEFQTLKPKLN